MFKKTLIVGAIAVVVSLGGVAVVWRASRSVSGPEPVNQISVPPTSTQPQSTADTADWQTYRNDTYGFEVKYPKMTEKGCEQIKDKTQCEWIVNETAGIEKDVAARIYFGQKQSLNTYPNGLEVAVSRTDRGRLEHLQSIYSNQGFSFKRSVLDGKDVTFVYDERGVLAYAYISNGGWYYEISTDAPLITENEFPEFLRSFHFTN